MSESPFDGRVTRRVKMAANVIDRFRYRMTLMSFSLSYLHQSPDDSPGDGIMFSGCLSVAFVCLFAQTDTVTIIYCECLEPFCYKNSSGDEIANANFLRRYGTYVLQNTKKENLLRLTN